MKFKAIMSLLMLFKSLIWVFLIIYLIFYIKKRLLEKSKSKKLSQFKYLIKFSKKIIVKSVK